MIEDINLQDLFDNNSSKKFKTRSDKSKEHMAKLWQSEDYRKMMSASHTNKWQDPTHKAQRLAIMKEKVWKSYRVMTPLGLFESAADAARAHKFHYNTIRRFIIEGKPGFSYADMSEKEHNEMREKYLKRHQQIKERKEKEIKENPSPKVRWGRAVKTPIGVFASLTLAGEALNVTRECVRLRIKKRYKGYGFIDKAV